MLDYAIDEKYAAFLRHANGWDGFYQTVDLLGTHDLAGSARSALADELLGALDESVLEQIGLQRCDLLPIAVTAVDIDLFCIGKPSSSEAGGVFWFAGTLIESFPDFDAYFLAMVDYNRRQIALM